MASAVYTPEQKAAAVADLLAGNSQRHVAKLHHLPRGTVARWHRESVKALAVVPPAAVSPDVAEALAFQRSVRVALNDLVLKNLRALVTVDGLTEKVAWLERQDAAELAVFYGVLFDKTYRLLKNYTPASQGAEEPG